MSSCSGKVWLQNHMSLCSSALSHCKKCGNVGCSIKGCTNQGFQDSKCKKCGADSMSRETFDEYEHRTKMEASASRASSSSRTSSSSSSSSSGSSGDQGKLIGIAIIIAIVAAIIVVCISLVVALLTIGISFVLSPGILLTSFLSTTLKTGMALKWVLSISISLVFFFICKMIFNEKKVKIYLVICSILFIASAGMFFLSPESEYEKKIVRPTLAGMFRFVNFTPVAKWVTVWPILRIFYNVSDNATFNGRYFDNILNTKPPIGVDLKDLESFVNGSCIGKVVQIGEQWYGVEDVGILTDFKVGTPFSFTIKSLDGKEQKSFETNDLNEIQIIANSAEEYYQKYSAEIETRKEELLKTQEEERVIKEKEIIEANRIAEENKRIEEENKRVEEESKQREEEALKQKEEADTLKVKIFFENGIEKAKKVFSESIVNFNDSYFYLSDGSLSGKFYIVQAKNLEIKTKGVIPEDITFKEPNDYNIEKSGDYIWSGEVAYIFKEYRLKEIPKKFIDSRKIKGKGKVYYVEASRKIYKYINVIPWSDWEQSGSESETQEIKFNFSESNGIWEVKGFEGRSLNKAGIDVDKISL